MLPCRGRILFQVTRQCLQPETGLKLKFRISTTFSCSQNHFGSVCLSTIDKQFWFWMRPSANAVSRNKCIKMALQKPFPESFLKGNAERKLAVKRKATKVGWLLAGCCFSKKSRKDSVGSDTPATENRPDTSYSESSRLLPPEEISEVPVVLTVVDPSIKSIAFREVAVSEEEKSAICFKDSSPKEKEEETVPKVDDHVRSKDVPGKAKKPRPNYFVAVQVDNPEIRESLQAVQGSLLEHQPLLKKTLISLSTLHITFVVMRIEDENQLERAKNALVDSYENIKEYLKDTPLILTFEGLSDFRKQVLFAELKIDKSHRTIFTLYEKIASCFELHGFNVREKNGFTPHLTVAKLSKDPKLYRKGVKRISPAWYENFQSKVFGEQMVKSLQLLKMQVCEDGYYPCDKECFFGFTSTEPNVPMEKKLLSVSLEKKEVRKKIRDLTNQKLALHEPSSS